MRNRTRDEHGRLRGTEYSIYEYPQKPETDSPASGSPMLDLPTSEKPTQDIPTLEKPAQENPRQLNTNKSNTEIINNGDKEREKDKEKERRHKYGEYQNVLLSDDEMERLKEDYPQDYQQWIERLSEYIASTGKTYKSHLATIRCWARREQKQASATSRRAAYSHDKYNCKDGDSL